MSRRGRRRGGGRQHKATQHNLAQHDRLDPIARKQCVAGTESQPRGSNPATTKERKHDYESANTSAEMRRSTASSTRLPGAPARQQDNRRRLRSRAATQARNTTSHTRCRMREGQEAPPARYVIVRPQWQVQQFAHMCPEVCRNWAVPEGVHTGAPGQARTTGTQYGTARGTTMIVGCRQNGLYHYVCQGTNGQQARTSHPWPCPAPQIQQAPSPLPGDVPQQLSG